MTSNKSNKKETNICLLLAVNRGNSYILPTAFAAPFALMGHVLANKSRVSLNFSAQVLGVRCGYPRYALGTELYYLLE